MSYSFDNGYFLFNGYLILANESGCVVEPNNDPRSFFISMTEMMLQLYTKLLVKEHWMFI